MGKMSTTELGRVVPIHIGLKCVNGLSFGLHVRATAGPSESNEKIPKLVLEYVHLSGQ